MNMHEKHCFCVAAGPVRAYRSTDSAAFCKTISDSNSVAIHARLCWRDYGEQIYLIACCPLPRLPLKYAVFPSSLSKVCKLIFPSQHFVHFALLLINECVWRAWCCASTYCSAGDVISLLLMCKGGLCDPDFCVRSGALARGKEM